MNKIHKLFLACVCAAFPLAAWTQTTWSNDFSNLNESLKTVGRGTCSIVDGIFRSQGSYALFGNPEWKNYTMSFKARAPKGADQVQIWAGFRTHNRFDRYVVGIKGGLQDDLYLMRTGYMGTDEFMGIRPLGFHPVPGEWYKMKVEVCGSRIRVFLNDEKLPYIDLEDKNGSLAPSGEVALGGGWIETEFDDLTITPLPEDALKDVRVAEYHKVATPQEKENKRRSERAGYSPVKLETLTGSRTDINLDGNWLFMPDYQLDDKDKAVSAQTDDQDWHVMTVPNFWTPIRIWLHGETMPSPTGPQPKGVSDTYYQQETDRCENYTFDYRRLKYAWYRQWLELPAEVDGKNLTLTFDAVSKLADIYINGTLAKSHLGMFGEIQVDGSKLLKPGKNLIAVKVTRKLDGSEAEAADAIDFFYSSVRESEQEDAKVAVKKDALLKEIAHGFYGDEPAGIWQPVKLTVTSPVKVEDAFIKPALSGATFDVTVKNHDNKKTQFDLYTDIIDKETGSTLYSGLSLQKLVLNGSEEKMVTYSIDDLKPRLWTPQHPNLYDFRFRLVAAKGAELDCLTETSGFRTFEVKEGLFFLNGNRYWLRGGNHIPFALAPNDQNLANTFMQLMKQGNADVTRTHTTPWNKLWMGAADTNGIGVSFEGTWSWLMIHSTPIPDRRLIDMWRDEFLGLLKKYRNHPSLLFWTVNNEMKFYDNDNDLERAKEKFRIISDVVKEMRRIDPTRPICFDSNYQAKGKKEKFGADFMASVDDGDIDDMHGYYNWYDYSLFRFFNGEFQQRFKLPNRPLISQEMSTGYPNNETGHPTRSYQLIHQNPYTLIGYEAYDWADPASFLKVQSFITGELAEAFRRSDDQGSGIIHFAYMTWFRQCYNYQNIEPWPTYYALQRALQPVLVSAELWGRNLYAGEKLTTRFYVVNDREDGTDLQPSVLRWELQDETGKRLIGGSEEIPAVKHYRRHYIEPEIYLPAHLPSDKVKGKLVLKLTENGVPVSENEYELLFAQKEWNTGKVMEGKKIMLLDKAGTQDDLRFLGVNYQSVTSVKEMLDAKRKADLCVISGLTTCTDEEAKLLRIYQSNGGKLLFLNSKETARSVYPEYITDWIIPTEGDIVIMERNDAPVFDDIDVLELRYFNNNKREIPLACNATLKAVRHENVTELAGQMKIHAYIDGGKPEDRIERIESMRGLTLLQISDGKGKSLVSTLCTEKATTDPIAGKLLVNMMNELLK
ncbi:glycoside hydrolase family 2 TIM barrel-domain containing protein [Bacteroides sp. 51]|uniref:glycoside hydrolase family 2 TIM barrel-domain containing protein n=1 Tax=Bacteroides sp. 51 TaxID=2302938 RepID=UPI0013D844FF|nr:glycoside hydrolase family 2 TIM barrel-domain containing protein [Bacteroides sp. 51]NDV81738.1 glycoside hydrolase family 2 [Bacteroides sp. 51]